MYDQQLSHYLHIPYSRVRMNRYEFHDAQFYKFIDLSQSFTLNASPAKLSLFMVKR